MKIRVHWLLGQFQSYLAQTLLCQGISKLFKRRAMPSQRDDKSEIVKIYWRLLNIIFSRTGLILTEVLPKALNMALEFGRVLIMSHPQWHSLGFCDLNNRTPPLPFRCLLWQAKGTENFFFSEFPSRNL